MSSACADCLVRCAPTPPSLPQLTYEMCALTVPFNAKNFQDLRKEIVQSKPLSLSR
jgi:hypothetical protein